MKDHDLRHGTEDDLEALELRQVGQWQDRGAKLLHTPYLGYPYYSSHDELIHNDYHNDDCPPMRGFYRWHIPDPIRFRSNLKVTVQQIGVGHRGFFF